MVNEQKAREEAAKRYATEGMRVKNKEWLEKQGEQKPTDKIKSKFNVGNWIIRNAEGFKHNIYLVTEVKDYYVCEDMKGRLVTFTFDDVHKNFKLWDISAAKGGDVIYYKCSITGEYIIMFKGINSDNNVDSYFRYSSFNGFGINIPSVLSAELDDITPATKEQRDLLFQKMKEAGYEWDAETKVLNKIEQNSADKVEPHFHVEKGKWYVCIKNNVGITQGNVYYGISDGYIIDDNGKRYNCNNWAVFQRYLRLWTILDAKDGDVLAWDDSKCIDLFKSIYNEEYIISHGFVRHFTGTFEAGKSYRDIKGAHPATKEQRDILFRKMKEAGYEWDAETNMIKRTPAELAKIEDDRIRKNIKLALMSMKDNLSVFYSTHHTSQKELLAWLEKQGTTRQLYVRFGDIPDDEKSKIYRGDEGEIGEEDGVSVYPAFEVDGNIVLGLTLPITRTTLHTQQHLLEYDDRPCYLVSGDYVGKGVDGEPLIRNVSIIKQVDNYRIKEPVDKPEHKPEPKSKKRNDG